MKPRLPFSEKLLPVVFIILAAGVFISIWRIPFLETTDKVGPRFYPFTLALLLAGCSSLLLLGFERTHKKESVITIQGIIRRFLPLIIFCSLYVAAMPLLGFLIATPALLIACIYLLGERNLGMNILISAGCTGAIYLLFATALGVQIPAVPWFLID